MSGHSIAVGGAYIKGMPSAHWPSQWDSSSDFDFLLNLTQWLPVKGRTAGINGLTALSELWSHCGAEIWIVLNLNHSLLPFSASSAKPWSPIAHLEGRSFEHVVKKPIQILQLSLCSSSASLNDLQMSLRAGTTTTRLKAEQRVARGVFSRWRTHDDASFHSTGQTLQRGAIWK